jgi:hypothetical protein
VAVNHGRYQKMVEAARQVVSAGRELERGAHDKMEAAHLHLLKAQGELLLKEALDDLDGTGQPWRVRRVFEEDGA